MDNDTIRAIVRDAISGEIAHNWPTFLLLVVATGIVGAICAYFGAYLKVWGSNTATREDFEKLLSQVGKTTEATEQIKREISHEDWTSREIKTLRRSKLEDFLIAVFEIENWIERERHKIHDEIRSDNDPHPLGRARLIVSLYFPEISTEWSGFKKAFYEYWMWLLKTKTALAQAKKAGLEAYQLAMENSTKQYETVYQPFIESIAVLETKCHELLKSLMGVNFLRNH